LIHKFVKCKKVRKEDRYLKNAVAIHKMKGKKDNTGASGSIVLQDEEIRETGGCGAVIQDGVIKNGEVVRKVQETKRKHFMKKVCFEVLRTNELRG